MIADILHKIAGMERDEQAYRPRPSLAGPERCIRQLTYLAAGAPKDKEIGDRFLHVMNDSSWHEELTADWIRKSAYQLHSEQMRLDCGGGISGSIDGILTDIVGNEYLFEHKAINHFTFERYAKGIMPLDYFTQCALYLNGLQAINPSITKAVLLIKNKNTSAFMEFILFYQKEIDLLELLSMTTSEKGAIPFEPYVIPDILKNTFEKFAAVSEHARTGTLPERPFAYGAQFPCGYCGWETTCWSEYEVEHEAKIDDVTLAGEIINLARYYCETNMHLKEMEKEKDSLKEKIQNILKEAKAKSVRAGEYKVKITLIKKSALNKDLIPPDILNEAMEEKIYEVLSIRKTAPEGRQNNKKGEKT